MGRELLGSLERSGVEHELVEKRLSRSIHEVGRPSPAKMVRAIAFLGRLLGKVEDRDRFAVCIYFLSCSGASFLIDSAAISLLARRGVPVVPYLHGIGFRRLAESGAIRRALVERAFRRARAVVVLGGSAKADVSPWVPDDRTFIVPNTVPDPGTARRPHGNGVVRCLYLSTLEPSKGALEFVQAAEIVLAAHPASEFLLAGQAFDGAFRRSLEELVRARSLAPRVTLVGAVFGEEKETLLASADLFVFPTRYPYENQPLVILEAMRHGLPVVATGIGCIPDQVADGITGFVLRDGRPESIADRVLSLCRDPGMRRSFGAAGRDAYERTFSPSLYDARWRFVLDSVGR
jgi:glycosyltransferase involved in cell wall biosynthesis